MLMVSRLDFHRMDVGYRLNTLELCFDQLRIELPHAQRQCGCVTSLEALNTAIQTVEVFKIVRIQLNAGRRQGEQCADQ